MERRNVLILGGKKREVEFISVMLRIYREVGIEELIYFPGAGDDFHRTLVSEWLDYGIKLAADDDIGAYFATYGMKVDYNLDDAIGRSSAFVCFDRAGYELLNAGFSEVNSGKKLVILPSDFSQGRDVIYAEGIQRISFEGERILYLRILDGIDYSISYFVKLLEKSLTPYEGIENMKFFVVRDIGGEGGSFKGSEVEKTLRTIFSNECRIHVSVMEMSTVKDFVYFDVVFRHRVDAQRFIDLFELDRAIAMTNKKNVAEIKEVEELLRGNHGLLYLLLMSVSSIEVVNERELMGYFFVTPHFCETFNIVSAIMRYLFPRSSDERMRKLYVNMVGEI